MAQRILQANRVDVAIGPQVLGDGAAVSSGWFSMAAWAELAVVLVLKGTLAAGETVTLALRQATSAAGGGAKALAEKVITAGEAAGNLLMGFNPIRRAVLTLNTVIATDAVDVNSSTFTFVGGVHTISLGTVIATDAVVVNGTTLTFVASAPGAGDVLLGANPTAAATNLAAAIDALDGVTATATGPVVTVIGTAAAAVITTTDTTITIAAAGFSAGNVSTGATDTAAATNLATAIDALPGISATSTGAVVTVVSADLDVSTSDATITIVMSAVADGDALEVNGETLTFKATGTGTQGAAAAGEVLLGATDNAAAANLAAAISAIPGLAAVATNAAGENPALVAISASVPAGVTLDVGDTALLVGTTEDQVLLALDVEALDVNAGFGFVQVQATASAAGLTGAAVLMRGGGRVAVRQDV